MAVWEQQGVLGGWVYAGPPVQRLTENEMVMQHSGVEGSGLWANSFQGQAPYIDGESFTNSAFDQTVYLPVFHATRQHIQRPPGDLLDVANDGRYVARQPYPYKRITTAHGIPETQIREKKRPGHIGTQETHRLGIQERRSHPDLHLRGNEQHGPQHQYQPTQGADQAQNNPSSQ
ncbi:uncharacterized protein BDZ99DRAFT_514073 [Mytilinidion resinicola]|uniref:Uncharacterized protein n=1 Tax=Mytilinidion resinicola TaxID=574789 RepID=A0A6A6ZAY1_9PEZI|nr:uncharacterized protein BDZ99DRAFT_514073 [Mytilinidion resinicola]KAF2817859.1 hypothetical protein BDZ99DRAFT_514073 [Mytilinidion resinicola]